MELNKILLFCGGIFFYRLLFNQRGKQWVLFITSLLAIFWLQPGSLIRNSDFWLPLATISLIFISWIVITPRTRIFSKVNIVSFLLIFSIPVFISLLAFLPTSFLITATIPPQFPIVTSVVLVIILSSLIIFKFKNDSISPYVLIFGILLLFVAQKNPELNMTFIKILTGKTNQVQSLQTGQTINLSWLGFSYVAFRLIHTIRDFQNGRFQDVDLRIYINYVIYFPAISAGPIDRIQNFEKELIKETNVWDDALPGVKRITLGLVKKFVFADLLFIFAINPTNIQLVKTSGWLWVMLLAYSMMIYLDFSGYTDIALGMSSLIGITLPENFNHPYLSENPTSFWNRWHMSLTQWIRAYFYFPLIRFFRAKTQTKSVFLLNSFAQVSTMILIALWHGITLNFIIWGLWHGFGLILHSCWTSWMQKTNFPKFNNFPSRHFIKVTSILLTFIYTSLGWIWFAIPDFSSATLFFFRLFNFNH